VNGKYYIGKHQTKNLDDGYMGSGKLLKRAIKKHGIANFTKEILHIFQIEEEMDAMEKELVVLSEMSYNICEGGQGGFGYINASTTPEERSHKAKRSRTNKPEETLKKRLKEEKDLWEKYRALGLSALERCHKKYPNGTFFGKKHTSECKQNHSKKMKGRIPWNKGIPRTEKEKENIKNGMKSSRL
jgi:hypothetical protein